MYREVKLVLILSAVFIFTFSTVTFIRKHVSLMQIEGLDAPVTEHSEPSSEPSDEDPLTSQQKQQNIMILQALEKDHRQQVQIADTKLMESINEQPVVEEASLCPAGTDAEQCS